MGARKYYCVGGKITSNPNWSQRDARGFALFALKVGAMEACIERARRYPPANRGPYDQVACIARPSPVRVVRSK